MKIKTLSRRLIYLIYLLIFLSIVLLVSIKLEQIEKFLIGENNLQASLLPQGEQLIAEVPEISQNLKPIRDWSVSDLKINAKAAICAEMGEMNNDKVLFKENENEKLSIASLTKLMTALVVLKNYDLEQVTIVSKEATDQAGEQGLLTEGEMFSIKNLLYITLIESSNDAAYSLAEIVGFNKFVDLMNSEALKLDMSQTRFVDPSGIGPNNYSSAQDLVKLAKYISEKYPLIWKISSQKNFKLLTSKGKLHHILLNTNELLEKIPSIVGGKTGLTEEARGCLLLVVKNPKNQNNIIYVILGSEDRFGEMEKLIDWVRQAYAW